MMRDLEDALRRGLTELTLAANDNQVASLLDYLALLQKWNKVYNLTAVRDPTEMLTYHLLDCVAVISPLRTQLAVLCAAQTDVASGAPRWRLLDVGSGAGLPGIVIAILCPEIEVDCVDAVAKKVGFINQVALTLHLKNLHGLHSRVEELTGKYDIISSRAFASLSDFVSLSEADLAATGVWMAMKGRQPFDEILALPTSVKVFHVEQLRVPGLGAERCIVWMRKI